MLKARRQRRGANALEFALLMPIFIAIVFGIFDVGWLMYRNTMLEVALAESCREASLIDPGIGDVNAATLLQTARDRALERLEELTTCNGCAAEAEIVGTGRQRSVVCTLTNTYTPLSSLTLGTFEMTNSTAVQLEYQRGS